MIRFMSLNDVCTDIIDCPHESPEWLSEGIAVIRNFNLVEGQIDMTEGYYVDEETYARRTRRAVPACGDIIFSREAPIGNCGIIPEGFTCCLGQRLVLLRVNHEVCSSEYLLAVLQSSYVKQQIEQVSKQGSTVSNFAIGDLRELVIPVLTNQDDIAAFSHTISNKLLNNKTICSDLEGIAKLLYDYWFVQFDFPDENGKPYKSSGGKMVWNEQLRRKVPEGWEIHSLQDCISSSKNGDWGNDIPKKEDDIKVRCFRGADFASITRNYQTTAPIRYISKNNSDRLLSDGDLVVEISGGSPVQSTGRVGYINQKFLDRCGGVMDCSNFCKAFTPKKRIYQYWLYQTWKMYYDAGVMFNFESKTTGIKNLMFDSVIRDIIIPLPPDELLSEYQKRVSLFYDKIQDMFRESAELAELRDFLLPMLMNGQVRVGKNR